MSHSIAGSSTYETAVNEHDLNDKNDEAEDEVIFFFCDKLNNFLIVYLLNLTLIQFNIKFKGGFKRSRFALINDLIIDL